MTALRSLVSVLLLAFGLCSVGAAQEAVFSGPQVGEILPPLSVRNIVGPQAGEESDPVATADGKPLLLIFIHKRERPAFGLANTLTKAAVERKPQGLRRQLVFLTDDPTATESWLKQIAGYFEKDTPVAISTEGPEGPGAYGLNRNVTMTVLVAREGKATANFALVQPSLAADGPKILKAIWDATGGGAVPEITKFAPQAMRARMRAGADDPQDEKLRGLLRGVIQEDASAEQVEKAAKAIEDYVTGNRIARSQLGQITRRVVDSPRFAEYATAAAREKLKAWAEKYGPAAEEPAQPQPPPAAPQPSPKEDSQ
jgi:hypothetical protein